MRHKCFSIISLFEATLLVLFVHGNDFIVSPSGGFPVTCGGGDTPIQGLCVKNDVTGWCFGAPIVCASASQFLNTGDSSQQTEVRRGNYNARISCPPLMAVRSLCLAVGNDTCSGRQVELQCRSNVEPPPRDEVCFWRGGGESGTERVMRCRDDEVLTGVCVSSGGDGCSGTGPQGVAIRCCSSGPLGGCSPSPRWIKDPTLSCPEYTAVTALCSHKCDPDGIWGENDEKNVSQMIFCQGLVFTHSNEQIHPCAAPGTWSTCSRRDEVIVRVTREGCSDDASFRAVCRDLRFSIVQQLDCITLVSNSSVWCPREYVMTSVCAPDASGSCLNNSNTAAICCRVRSDYQGGNPCRMGYVYTVVGGVASRQVPGGIGTAAAVGVGLRPTSPTMNCGNCIEVVDAQLWRETNEMFVLARRIRSLPNMGFILSYDASLGQSPVTRFIVGSFTTIGHTPEDVNATGYSSFRNMTFSLRRDATLTVTPSGLLFVVEESYVRLVHPQAPFWARVFTGAPTPGEFVNRSAPLDSRYMQTRFTAYWAKTEQLFLSADSFIADFRFSVMNYFVGNGGTFSSYGTNVFRTEQPASHPAGISIFRDAVMYFADSTLVHGGIIEVNLATGMLSRMAIDPPISPYALAVYRPQHIFESVKLYCTFSGHSLFEVDTVTGHSRVFSGSRFTAGFVDNVALDAARFRFPKTLTATDTTLFISDTDNGAVRAIPLTPCSLAFNSTERCLTCSQGFYKYPRCRDTCTIEDDCFGRASSVSGTQPDLCYCTCSGFFTGRFCEDCVEGMDRRFACTTCAPGFVGTWPNCRTPTISVSLTPTSTRKGTSTATIPLPRTRTLTLVPKVEPSTDVPSNVTDLTPQPSSESGNETNPPKVPPGVPCEFPECTRTATASLPRLRTVTRSRSPTGMPAPSRSRTRSPSFSRSPTRTPTLSTSSSASMAPVPHGMIRRFVNGTWQFFTRSISHTPSASGSRTHQKTSTLPLPTPAPPRPTSTPRPPSSPRPPGTDEELSHDPGDAPGLNTTSGNTELTIDVPTASPTSTMPPIPTARPRLPAIIVEVTGRVLVDAIMDGGDVESRTVSVRLINAKFDPVRCQSPGAITFEYDRRRDLSFLNNAAVWCNTTFMTIVVPTAARADVATQTAVTIVFDNALKDGHISARGQFTIEPRTVSPAAQAAQTAATATTLAASSIGGSGAIEIQGLALMGMVSCADPRMKGVMQSARGAISPWKLGDDELGYLLGNFAIVAIGSAALGLAVLVLFLKFKYDQSSGKAIEPVEFPDPTEDETDREPLARALTTVSMPGKLHVVLAIMHQGICIESHMRLHDPYRTTVGLVLGIFGLMYSIALPILLAYWMKKHFHAKCYRYKYVQHQAPAALRIIIPKAFWLPAKYTKRFGAFFKDYFNTDIYLAIYDPLVKINIVSMIAAFPVPTGGACSIQYSFLGMVYVLEALFRIIRWPNTTTAGNVSRIAACITTAMLASSAGFSYTIVSTEVAMLVQSYFSVACNLLAAVLMLIDRLVWQAREIKARYENGDFEFIENGTEVLADEKGVATEEGKAGDDTSGNERGKPGRRGRETGARRRQALRGSCSDSGEDAELRSVIAAARRGGRGNRGKDHRHLHAESDDDVDERSAGARGRKGPQSPKWSPRSKVGDDDQDSDDVSLDVARTARRSKSGRPCLESPLLRAPQHDDDDDEGAPNSTLEALLQLRGRHGARRDDADTGKHKRRPRGGF